MQTVMNGTDLKFDFFGTKTKSGTMRGPNFITGDSTTPPSPHTPFSTAMSSTWPATSPRPTPSTPTTSPAKTFPSPNNLTNPNKTC
jgi:hypothetical protein